MTRQCCRRSLKNVQHEGLSKDSIPMSVLLHNLPLVLVVCFLSAFSLSAVALLRNTHNCTCNSTDWHRIFLPFPEKGSAAGITQGHF